jgi:hypothetical protein
MEAMTHWSGWVSSETFSIRTPGKQVAATLWLLKSSRSRTGTLSSSNTSGGCVKGVVFITLHLVGSNNGLVPFEGRTAQHNEEVHQREGAMLTWLSEGFELAGRLNSPGVVVAIHANPRFDDPFPPSEIPVPDSMRLGFEAFLETIENETIAFRRPVLLIHGDSHYFRVDKPLYNSGTRRRLENFTRLETFGAPDFHWINVRVDPGDPRVFRITEQLIPENLEGYGEQN